MRTANPAFSSSAFQDEAYAPTPFQGSSTGAVTRPNTMTVSGVVNKTSILLGLTLFTAVIAWNLTSGQTPKMGYMPLLLGGGIGGFIVAMITAFKPRLAPITAPIYALLEGLFVGSVSALYATMSAQWFKGGAMAQDTSIVLNAAVLTFGVLAAMLVLYRMGVIKPTEKFKAGVAIATGGVFIAYLLSFVLGFAGVNFSLFSLSPIGLGISGVIVVIASLNLILDFDFVSKGVAAGAPRKLEWYAGFGLLVTLVWLYIEILRLLFIIQSLMNRD